MAHGGSVTADEQSEQLELDLEPVDFDTWIRSLPARPFADEDERA
jgi:hypothetical protein